VQKERNKAVHLVLGNDGTDVMTAEEERRKIVEASKPFEEQMDKIRGAFEFGKRLTAEEAKAIVPNIGDDIEDDGKESKKGGGEKDKDGEKEESGPPRVVTDKGFPVTKAGFDRFVEINQEVDKRDQDLHDMYIYNDFSGYGVTEVLENEVS
jgi:hypothetical protein